jgi:hypothetical protein
MELERQENGKIMAHRIKNLDQDIPVVQHIRQRELALENWVKEGYIVI